MNSPLSPSDQAWMTGILVALLLAPAILLPIGIRAWAGDRTGWMNRAAGLPLPMVAVLLALVVLGAVILIDSALLPLAAVMSVLSACRAAQVDGWGMFGLRKWPSLSVLLMTPLFYFSLLIPIGLASFFSKWACDQLGILVESQTLIQFFKRLDEPLEYAGFFVLASLLAPLTEELFFRGFLYGWLKQKIPRWMALGIASALFALAHMHAPTFLPLLILGLSLALVYEATGTLWAPMFLHAFFNTMTLLAILRFPQLAS